MPKVKPLTKAERNKARVKARQSIQYGIDVAIENLKDEIKYGPSGGTKWIRIQRDMIRRLRYAKNFA